ncbi:MAPEG family protein [Sphingopyxis panaciterrulae]|uniref:Putative MAPEG superfamily protein n=1 Tax=Sphingopyxis panaciterrulae TaxID=462372 RepID=A0A7W9ESP4_9SPHN|nr:MAPEG family protein [Sphingopyxis panaciterrulae]MBB5707161.1 putative MAPEG superfamily protein [Sphingopyxis panaciterrulae]
MAEMDDLPEPAGDGDWRRRRRAGMISIAGSVLIAALLWFGLRWIAPTIPGMEALADRLIYAFKWWCLALFFCFAMGVEAVAHERLQSPAFDPLTGYETRRLRVNLRYLQNTLEQFLLFTAALFGLALYSDGGDAMRAVQATAIVWTLCRFAFWIGYHRSAAMRGLGAAGVMLVLIVLIYLVARIAFDLGGPVAAAAAIALFVAIEFVLFRTTRART